MKIGIFGTGVVGQTLGAKLVASGHQVMLGSRTAENPDAQVWAKKAGRGASHGTFGQAAKFGEILLNCTHGQASVAALGMAASADLKGKVLVDVSNPLDFSKGMPPSLFVSNTESLGEQIQAAFPAARVVKTLNTVSAPLMVDPGRLKKGEHTVFVCGNDDAAKRTVERLLRESLGWKDVVDLGDITMARGTEAYLLLWTRLYQSLGSPEFNLHVVR